MNLEHVQEVVRMATSPAFRERLLARGQARSMIWRNGTLPPEAPNFSPNLSYDLESYAYSLLSMAIRIREGQGDVSLMRAAFEQAASALEAVVAKGNQDDPERDFHRLLAACSFHLGKFSARAFSLLSPSLNDSNLSPIEQAVANFVLRSFEDLEREVASWCLGGAASDERLASLLASVEDNQEIEDDDDKLLDAIDLALTQNFMRGIGAFLLALDSGDAEIMVTVREILTRGLEACTDLNLVPQWWCYRLTLHMLDDLWFASFHHALPISPSLGDATTWGAHRSLFIALLSKRQRADIELWPSQIEAAKRAVDVGDDLVVSLPTSAGKTRIAELCILRTLSEGKRAVFVTPLRALSAQTEVSLRRTFGPLGKRISTLYGSIGTSRYEVDALRECDIVVATPEKLDFALRSEPGLLDDIGLVVLDEGHMIGLGEREVRYEVQIQRLLKRSDADGRRIVCLSAILPSGEQFEDFVKWIRADQEGTAVTSDWRPTRIRYGEVLWSNNRARLELRVGEERPFVPSFLLPKTPTKGKRTEVFPRDQRELTLATAWRLVEDGQSVLIYCPQRRSVEPFAKAIVDLNSRGLLKPVLFNSPAVLNTAISIGAEWLGADHPILSCLRLGVAVHHGALPTAFRKEMEHLLREGVLKVTVSSPTLAQGLNLSATAIVIHSLYREREPIPASEFKNVVGRAGRAFIDLEGLVLFPIFENHAKNRSQWSALISDTTTLSMESGLLRLVATLLNRMHKSLGQPSLESFVEYVMNNAGAWEFPEIKGEDGETRLREKQDWTRHLATLDTAVLGLAGEQEVAAADLPAFLDEVLESSLWARRLGRKKEGIRAALREGLQARAKFIWMSSSAVQRKGYFLAGIGLTAGQRLDSISTDANALLVEANGAILSKDHDKAISAIVALAELLFCIPPFVPDPLPGNWKDVLRMWLEGAPIAGFGGENGGDILRFVENGLVYRLPWGMEAIRVRAQANLDWIDEWFRMDDFEVGLAVPAVETGTLIPQAAILMQAGFTSRIAAIKVVKDTQATFVTGSELTEWLHSDIVSKLTELDDWPTAETSTLWKSFVFQFVPAERGLWSRRTDLRRVRWVDGIQLPGERSCVRIHNTGDGRTLVLSITYEALGSLEKPIAEKWSGLLVARITGQSVLLEYFGPNDISL